MEEDIERIENLIKKCDECKLKECINCEISWIDVQAIGNLLKAYKELEEENKELLEVKISASAHNRILELEKENNQLKLKIADLYKSRGEYEKAKSIMTNELRDYIPKYLIKEKIEELNTMIIETHRGNLQRYTVSEILSFIRFCEELLGEEK